jgi:nitrile hydratase
MNGVHDMGGMHGFGPVEPEPNEPVFHAPWEARTYAMTRAMGYLGLWNIDKGRAARENLPPHLYLAASYYQKWFLGLQQQVLDAGLVAADEVAAGHALRPAKPVPRTLDARDVGKLFGRGSYARSPTLPARFSPGDRVRTRNINPATHTRLPRYARGRVGTVEAVRGCHAFPDSIVRGEGENPQWLYTVVFTSRELFGADADPTVTISIEAFEPYLEAA